MDDAETVERDPNLETVAPVPGDAEIDAQAKADAAANERRERVIDGLRHVDDQIAFYNAALVYVRANGHGNAEGVLLRIVRDLESLKAIPLPISEEDAEQESDDPIVALQRDNADLRRQLGQLQAVSPHGFVNTTRTLRPAPPRDVDKAPAPSVNGPQPGYVSDGY